MPAHNRGELSLEGYLLRVLAALCRQSGGELRIAGAEVDRVGEATSLIKEWDADRQQVVLRVETIGFREVFRLTPEKQPPQVVMRPAQVVDPIARTATPAQTQPTAEAPIGDDYLPKRSLLDEDERLIKLAKERKLAKGVAAIRAHLRQKEAERLKEQERIDL
jgi:hypothetical protein